ncbi:protein of unknown function DUF296 [Macleaya cordata]|uniref:AT-hook motif nuclear-localized protein n=1 Tax=Macleaya cordata TaxID=56857 RepID=A0A200PR39_MACCD|nr:protein of unknown function DUF296 [Macleaya cordata]
MKGLWSKGLNVEGFCTILCMMSGSEPAIMSARESFGAQKNQIHSQPSASPNMRLAFSSDGTAVYKPVLASSPTYQSSGGGGGGGGGDNSGGNNVQHGLNMNIGEPIKRKRGRPRKYGPDGTMALALTPAPPAVQVQVQVQPPPPPGFSSSSAASPPSSSSMKKSRGRPRGSSKKQQMDALGSAGIGFTPHVIAVKAGEDVSSKIMAFSQHGPRAVCILSANGAISNVTLRQAATSGGTVTYEGRFEILSLSGSFLLSESGGQRSRTGGLSVSLAGPDGRVLGGGVAGLLTAASPVQVVVGSFIAHGRKEAKSNQLEPNSAQPTLNAGGRGMVGGTGSPTSRGTRSESSGGPGSPLNQSTGACNNNNHLQSMANMPWK